MTDNLYLARLKLLLEQHHQNIPPWLEDLLVAGPRLEQWPAGKFGPNRVILTEFLARWLKAAGCSQVECLEWLERYCCEVLVQYSHSGMSAIRHGTKANVRWVYNSAFVFDFESMAKASPESGFEGHPAYMSVFAKWWDALPQEKARALAEYRERAKREQQLFHPVMPVKGRFRVQFEQGVALAQQKLEEGMKLPDIVTLLNGQGWLTKTGRRWTIGTLYRSVKDWEPGKSKQPAQTEPSADELKPPTP